MDQELNLLLAYTGFSLRPNKNHSNAVDADSIKATSQAKSRVQSNWINRQHRDNSIFGFFTNKAEIIH